jgi:RNA 3'-terminal phosphate cyclase (ATP)
MIRIDGASGEGGGQMLRTALSLSLVTGQAFRIENIRAKREKPGLLRQHLTAVLAAAEVGSGKTEGATLGSKTLEFVPGKIRPGIYTFAVGTAGSTTLVSSRWRVERTICRLRLSNFCRRLFSHFFRAWDQKCR